MVGEHGCRAPLSALLAGVLVAPAGGRQLLLRQLLLGGIYVAVGALSLRSSEVGSQLPLVWPSSGVAALWLLTSTSRTWRWDLLALLVAACASGAVAGSPWGLFPFRVVAALTVAGVFRLLVDRWTPLRADDGSLRHLSRISTIGTLALAALAAGLLQASVQELGQLVVLETVWLDFGHRWLRNATAVFAITTTAVLLLGPALGEPRRPRVHRWELLALVLVAVATFAVAFGLLPTLPMSFFLFLPSVWAGIRFTPAVAASLSLASGATAVGLTLAGIGMYAEIDQPVLGALASQLFLVMLFGTTLVISVTRSELAAAEREFQGRARLLDSVLETVGDGIALVQEGGRVVLLNSAARELLGVRSQATQVEELDLPVLYESDGQLLTLDRLHHERVLRGETVQGEDVIVREASGDQRTLRVSAHLMQTHPSQRRQVLVSAHDVTAERAHSAALASFAGEVAHDLKNPLTVVEGWSEMLEAELSAGPTMDSAEGLAMTRRIQGAAAHMRTLIGELLSYTMARDSELRPEPFVVGDLAEEVAALHRDAVTGEGPLIEVDAPVRVWGDRVLLRQVLDNLLGNSVKYVAPGVRPRVRVCARPTEDGRVQVQVVDNGLGVPVADRERVFESFYRLDRPGYSGTGLGLAICARIVARHDGALRVDPGPAGTGSSFSFVLAAPGA